MDGICCVGTVGIGSNILDIPPIFMDTPTPAGLLAPLMAKPLLLFNGRSISCLIPPKPLLLECIMFEVGALVIGGIIDDISLPGKF